MHTTPKNNLTIDDVYVDGVSITYSNAPCRHIWTYAGGPYDIKSNPIFYGLAVA